MKRITARIMHEKELEALRKHFVIKLGMNLSLNQTINYIIEKAYERIIKK